MDLEGGTLGQYQIVEELGRGAMAVVYKAYKADLKRYVAIKVLPPQFGFDGKFIQRFLRAARSAAELDHPNIVAVHEVAQADGYSFIVMPLLEGKPLDQLIAERKQLPLLRVEGITRQVADALAYAHERGVLHRDIKPANILVDEGENDRVTVTDFGLIGAAEGTALTKTGAIVGTPEYMSPEQAEGRAIDHRTDIYSLGVVVFQMTTGRVPFARSSPRGMLMAHMMEEPPSPSAIRPGVPEAVDAVVRKALQKDRDGRYAGAGDFGRELGLAIRRELPAVQAEEVAKRETSAAGAGGQRWIWALGFAGALLLVALCGAGALAFGVGPFGSQPASVSGPEIVGTAVGAVSGLIGGADHREDATVWTATPFSTHTPAPTTEPSATPSPTASPTVEPTATATATAAPTSTPTATPTPVPTATPLPTEPPPTATPQVVAPLLVAPPRGGTSGNPVQFAWDGLLSAGQSYRVTLRHPVSGAAMDSGALTASTWSVGLADAYIGEVVWSVSVVQAGSVVATSAESMFWFDPLATGGGD